MKHVLKDPTGNLDGWHAFVVTGHAGQPMRLAPDAILVVAWPPHAALAPFPVRLMAVSQAMLGELP